jgi:hypothetical protein
VSFAWLAYFSVASLYAFGHSMRFVSLIVIGHPRLMHHSMPGETRSFTLSMFASVILSPGDTSARAIPAALTKAATAHHRTSFLAIVPLLAVSDTKSHWTDFRPLHRPSR